MNQQESVMLHRTVSLTTKYNARRVIICTCSVGYITTSSPKKALPPHFCKPAWKIGNADLKDNRSPSAVDSATLGHVPCDRNLTT